MTHQTFECADGYLAQESFEFIYYDQLGSYDSDQPDNISLWTSERFVEEVEQVHHALNLDRSNFPLLGQSWGGILAMEYALKYQQNLKGLIISNMMSSVPEYNLYARQVLGPHLDPAEYKEFKNLENAGDLGNPRYGKLLFEHNYTQHYLKRPVGGWPGAILQSVKHINKQLYVQNQGYSEFGIAGDATLKEWDIRHRL